MDVQCNEESESNKKNLTKSMKTTNGGVNVADQGTANSKSSYGHQAEPSVSTCINERAYDVLNYHIMVISFWEKILLGFLGSCLVFIKNDIYILERICIRNGKK